MGFHSYKNLLSTSHTLDIVLDSSDEVINKTKSLPLWSLSSYEMVDEIQIKCIVLNKRGIVERRWRERWEPDRTGLRGKVMNLDFFSHKQRETTERQWTRECYNLIELSKHTLLLCVGGVSQRGLWVEAEKSVTRLFRCPGEEDGSLD